MTDVPNTQLFVPVGVQTFGLIDPNALNTNFSNVQAAFGVTRSTITGDTQLTATLRNVAADIGALGSPMLVTLPTNPTVGDPPCSVSVLTEYYGTIGGNVINCTITTSDSNPINGIIPAVGKGNVPSIFQAGDALYFVYVGGPVGWLCTAAPPAFSVATQLYAPTAGAFPWQSQTACFVLPPAGAVVSVEALQTAGAWGRVVRASGSNSISVGDATSTFNGVAGPYTVNTTGTVYKFTCLGNRAFEVTT